MSAEPYDRPLYAVGENNQRRMALLLVVRMKARWLLDRLLSLPRAARGLVSHLVGKVVPGALAGRLGWLLGRFAWLGRAVDAVGRVPLVLGALTSPVVHRLTGTLFGWVGRGCRRLAQLGLNLTRRVLDLFGDRGRRAAVALTAAVGRVKARLAALAQSLQPRLAAAAGILVTVCDVAQPVIRALLAHRVLRALVRNPIVRFLVEGLVVPLLVDARLLYRLRRWATTRLSTGAGMSVSGPVFTAPVVEEPTGSSVRAEDPEHLQAVLQGNRAERRAAQRQKGRVKPSLLPYGPQPAL